MTGTVRYPSHAFSIAANAARVPVPAWHHEILEERLKESPLQENSDTETPTAGDPPTPSEG